LIVFRKERTKLAEIERGEGVGHIFDDLLLYKHEPSTSKMSSLNATTPQLKVIKNMADALTSLNLSKFGPLFSKNYQYEAFNGITEKAKLDNVGTAESSQAVWAGLTKSEVTYHEVIEAPGKVIIHGSVLFHTASGTTLPYDTVVVISLGEEDGELKVLSIKDFPDPQKRNAFAAGAAKAAAEKGSAS